MAEGERDSTQDWVLPTERRPPTVFELEQRIDVALAVARASEAAALEIGAAALDSAEQARRAAELAERASAAVGAAGLAPAAGNGIETDPGNGAEPDPGDGAEAAAGAESEPHPGLENGGATSTDAAVTVIDAPVAVEDPLRDFSERADRVLARLRAIERLPRRTG